MGPEQGAVAPPARLLGGRGLLQLLSTNSGWRRPLAPGPQAFPCPPSWPGLPVSGEEASQRAPPAASGPADAGPRLWPEPHPAPSPRHRCSHSLARDELLGKITEPACLNPPLSGEKRAPFLLRPRAPGCPPRGPAAGCRSMRPLSAPLAPVLRSLQGDGWAEGRVVRLPSAPD